MRVLTALILPPKFLTVSEKDFWVYHPAVEGSLTMSLLKEIAERIWYKRKGFNPLIVAAFVGDQSLVHQLLEEGIDPKKIGRAHV